MHHRSSPSVQETARFPGRAIAEPVLLVLVFQAYPALRQTTPSPRAVLSCRHRHLANRIKAASEPPTLPSHVNSIPPTFQLHRRELQTLLHQPRAPRLRHQKTRILSTRATSSAVPIPASSLTGNRHLEHTSPKTYQALMKSRQPSSHPPNLPPVPQAGMTLPIRCAAVAKSSLGMPPLTIPRHTITQLTQIRASQKAKARPSHPICPKHRRRTPLRRPEAGSPTELTSRASLRASSLATTVLMVRPLWALASPTLTVRINCTDSREGWFL